MCGRFTRHYTWAQIRDLLDLPMDQAMELASSYNVAPTQMTPACVLDERGQRKLLSLRWGLVPAWSNTPSKSHFNARSETVATSPAFRDAYRKRRCLVPVSGFYEWKTTPSGKRPHWIHLLNDPILCIAGIWERHEHEGEPQDTFALLTTAPNEVMSTIHDRMPVIIAKHDHARWLDPKQSAADLFKPFPSEEMEAVPVGARVGPVRNNDPSLIVREDSGGLFG